MVKRKQYTSAKRPVSSFIALLVMASIIQCGCMGEWHGFEPQSNIGISFTLNPSSLDFGTITIGDLSTSAITISNPGKTDLRISDISLTDTTNFLLDISGGPDPIGIINTTIPAGQSRTVTVTFAPCSTDLCYASLMVDTEYPETSSHSVSLAGTGISTPVPNINTTPSDHSFGNIVTGDISTPIVITIANTGSADLHVSDINLTDGANYILDLYGGPFPCGSTNPTIPPGESRSASVSFGPLTTGTIEGELTMTSDDPDAPNAYISLSGTGVTAPEPEIDVSPTSHSFGTIERGHISTPLIVTISNIGEADLHISDIFLTDSTNFTLDVNGGANPSNSTEPTISAGENRTVAVTFGPFSTGTFDGDLIIQSDDPDNSPFTVSLSGTGEEVPHSDDTAVLRWDAPTTNTDGTELTDLSGFKIYYGPSPGYYTESIDVGNVTTYTLDDLPPGTFYISVSAYDISGNESDYSNEVSKTFN